MRVDMSLSFDYLFGKWRPKLKTWSVSELNNVAKVLAPLVGTRLQEVITHDNDVLLGFYTPKEEGLLWLWIDLSPVAPSVLPWSKLPAKLKNKKSPLELFLKAHFVNHALVGVRMVNELGRVLVLTFAAHVVQPPHEIEIQLIPHTRNLIARSGVKKIAWQKPAEREESEFTFKAKLPERDLTSLRDDWLESRKFSARAKSKGDTPREDSAKLFSKELERKTKALAKVGEELERKKSLPWKKVGEWLKLHQTLDVPKEWTPFVDARRKLSWNIDQCFTKARELEGKIHGTEQRMTTLKTELATLESRGEVGIPAKAAAQPLRQAGAEGRTLRLSLDVTVVSGKNAQDNLKLLRKARAWDLWFHMRDYPGRHAILFRNKKQNISDQDLHKVGLWFVKQHLGSKLSEHRGEKFAIVIAECRHVQPIKGDKVGRVTFRDERTLICKI
jgi:predicted ribosome quality control (RQC) complex YloA/Tae2 family protein